MLGRLNHVAIATRDAAAAGRVYSEGAGAEVSAPSDLPGHGVRIVFVTLPNSKVELIEPLGQDSPIARFLERNPAGGLHHVCYEVDDLLAARDTLATRGIHAIGDGAPKIGAHGKPVLFFRPADFSGVLTELEQA